MAPERKITLRNRAKSIAKGDALVAVRYEDSVAAKAPLPVIVAPPRAPPADTHPALRTPHDEKKRDSGLAPTTTSSSTAREGSLKVVSTEKNVLGVAINFDSPPPPPTAPLEPAQTYSPSKNLANTKIVKKSYSMSGARWRRPTSKGSRKSGAPPKTPTSAGKDTEEQYSPITTTIPTDSLLEADFLASISFSKRGSILLGGKKGINGHARPQGGRRQPSFSMLASPAINVLSDDLEKESQKVRSMYEQGSSLDWQEGKYSGNAELNIEEENPLEEALPTNTSNGLLSPNINDNFERPVSVLSTRSRNSEKKEHELAGGIEDWEDVDGNCVDRYGFIKMRRNSRPGTPEPRPPQRVSTVLQLASDTPRKKRAFGRSPSNSASFNAAFKRAPSRKVSARSLNTQVSSTSARSSSRAQLRAAANLLPGNRDRRWRDEAGDMLTLPPGLADIAEDEDGGKAAEDLKKKEWERAEKWRKMAKIVKTGKDGEGMEFEFDTRSSKLIERTWKGIPDRWRAAAWHSFLSSSAKKRKDSATDEAIIGAFHKLLQQGSADDVQIDIDVPRTINSHIMFRRRYRGGQRLLFRVLHSLTLYFPDTGYVQGMASLAATLLCYYDEERCFVMLVRMWTLRGLDKLYEAGFSGLMSALDELEKQWFKGGEVSQKLTELCIEPTAYGTRWYLTLFNYSIPFPAQLRVWDVFMLLGDSDLNSTPTKEEPFNGGLDVLHATSAALIDGMREILMDSDFENAMKVLTSWIPVKDEELLMRVTKAEWKLHRAKRRS
ncbi:TBC domain-containing protein [Lachnellula hyalina]|uniref:TBC domain-containing protein n=1 Tax=Lachnellula hyalina TaxID=1316788 RepID=A0A8H8TYC3_9HELO|nr:TBC domain-containing protein [Lachnellula hyalina]TVY26487.1 TBC domain-containing protein [Lachnellula hyalina]